VTIVFLSAAAPGDARRSGNADVGHPFGVAVLSGRMLLFLGIAGDPAFNNIKP